MISDRAKRAGLKELAIFDYFEIDRNLPKYKKDKDDYENSKMSFDGAVDSNQAWITVPTNDPMGGTLWVNGRFIRYRCFKGRPSQR